MASSPNGASLGNPSLIAWTFWFPISLCLFTHAPQPSAQQTASQPPKNQQTAGVEIQMTSFGNLPWREVFTDAHLQGLIEKALTNNPNLLNAALNVDMAQTQLKAAKLAFLPQFAFTPQGTITQFNDVTTKSYTLPVNASWNVSLFGGLTA